MEAFYQSVGNDGTSSSSSRKPGLDLNSTTAAENSYFLEELSRVEELERKRNSGEALSKEELEELKCRLDRLQEVVTEGKSKPFKEKWKEYPDEIRKEIEEEKRSSAFKRKLETFEEDRSRRRNEGRS